MAHRLEIALKPDLNDPEGYKISRKAEDYFGIRLTGVRVIRIITIEADLKEDELEKIKDELFTNPVTQISSYKPLSMDFDWILWIGYRPGVRDNPGATAIEAVEDIFAEKGLKFTDKDGIYTSKRYCIKGKNLTRDHIDLIAKELLANDIIQQWRIYSKKEWSQDEGVGIIIPRVILNHTPVVATIPIDSDETLKRISKERNLALNHNDIPVIRSYFLDKKVMGQRAGVNLSDPTDIELEYISQARSDHCNHNTFRGLFRYRENKDAPFEIEDNLFKKYIQSPTLELSSAKDWVVSVLWDNAGAGRFDDDHYYVITGETHNSPSNMEAYGGAITGIVGVYRDPLGTGKGAKLVMGCYGYCVGHRDYNGPLKPKLHPRRLLDGVIEGVRDGGNKSGIPTPFGQVWFHEGYMGKCLVFVTAVGIMPSKVANEPAEKKTTSKGDLVVMCGGRVGKDGIHGVTASSESFSENTPAGHVQIGDPYTQKKMHDFLLEARDKGLIAFITDNGGGGLSSSVGESARFSNGCEIDLEKVPLKYDGLDQWEIWVSESQERMTVAVTPDNIKEFLSLSQKHRVESTVIGKYTDTGKLHIKYNEKTIAYVDLDFLESGFPKWEFDAVWKSPKERGLYEPVLSRPKDYNTLVLDMLARPNIASKEWIARQYDHEVQGGSIIKPLVGRQRDVNSDAAVIRPVLTSNKGLCVSQALLPSYSAIDAYHMTACTIDEAVRRVVAVGADIEKIGGVDNFCWPDIRFDPETNPDGKFKAAQLVRACRALKDICMAYGIPLLSGKDSMYVDGHLPGLYGETHKVSALETIQFSTIAPMDNIKFCLSMDCKFPGDLIYIIGNTQDELGGSEYYDLMGYVGLNVPVVKPEYFFKTYKKMGFAAKSGLFASAHGVYRGGLCVHLALVSMGGNLGMDIDLASVPCDKNLGDDKILFSETSGRFIVTIDPYQKNEFEKIFAKIPHALIGKVNDEGIFRIKGKDSRILINQSVKDLKAAWKAPFGGLI